jgi:hypothetical protein
MGRAARITQRRTESLPTLSCSATACEAAWGASVLTSVHQCGYADNDGYTTAAESGCNDDLCVHWVETTDDSVALTDANGNGFPDYVDRVADIVSGVAVMFRNAGYRAVRGDGALGGNSKPDIYLANIGDAGLYGYCSSDQDLPLDGPYDAWAYCVLDNDYSAGQFPTNTPLENLQVTAAHEYFHAVQFAYDVLEDSWFMEATATWVEDELFDGVDDSVQYLTDSPLTLPATSMDTFGNFLQYGDWVFFRFLSERWPESQGGMPTIVRDMWRYADGVAGGPDDYSIDAVESALSDRGISLANAFALFADANRRPGTAYSEGASNRYPTSPLAARVTLTSRAKASTWSRFRRDHLTSATVSLTPGSGLSSAPWKLRVQIDLAPIAQGSAAALTVYRNSGSPVTQTVSLDASGDAVRKVAFRRGTVRYVEVTLVNASTRYDCWYDSPYSCGGYSLDDNLLQSVRGAVTR